MNQAPHIPDELLLDYVLEQCDEADAARVAAAIEIDAKLAGRFGRFKATLAPLNTWTTPPPPTSMVSDILDAVEAKRQADEQGLSVVPAAAGGERGPGGLGFSLRDLIALAACILLFVGIFAPSMSAARRNAQTRMCASNLRSLGVGMASYASANGGYLPYAGAAPGRPWLMQQGQPPAPNTRHYFLLLKGAHVNPQAAICPERAGDEAMSADAVQQCSDFPNQRNRSYHLQFMGQPYRLRGVIVPSDMPLLSDANPLFDDGTFNENIDPATTNSTSHRGLGQNVLHVDGHVSWYNTPVQDLPRDNIWQIGTLRQYKGSEAPDASTDVFMAP